ncbi:MAG: hypothetical protein ACRDPD_36165 [Streptosporangiaceae bacterium]
MNRLAGLHRHLAVIGFHDQDTTQHDREFVELRALPELRHPAGLRICAMLRPSWPVFARPTYSSISFGGWPAAATRLGPEISSGMIAIILRNGDHIAPPTHSLIRFWRWV